MYLGFLLGFTLYNIKEAKDKINVNNDKRRKVRVTGDSIQVLLPVLALALPILSNDEQAQQDFFRTATMTFLLTHLLKHGVNSTRPNGGPRSFPSGHTSSAFQGAASLHRQFGLIKALPAYLGASYVGYSRIYTKKHHTTDVLAGALLGFICGYKL